MTRVAIAGSSGLIGSALSAALVRRGDTVVRLKRASPARPGFPEFSPTGPAPDLTGFDAVINLCGVGVADRRWTGSVKQELRDSRIEPTATLAEAVAAARVPVYLVASGVGIYGDAGETACIDAPHGTEAGAGFLASLCVEWEAAAATARDSGAAVAHLRFGQVLSNAGGMLPVLRRVHRLGLGGRLAGGKQWLSWITRADATRAVLHVLDGALAGSIDGPVNVAGPNPSRQQEFSAELSRALHRPAPWVVPRVALRAVAGEFANEGLLQSQRVVPQVLLDTGFSFVHADLPVALEAALADGA